MKVTTHIPQISRRPFVLGPVETQEPDIPEGLEQNLAKGSKVMRYLFSTGELPHIFHDPVDVHTRRCVWTVDTLALPSWVDVDRIRRTLWIHDIPEIIANEEIGNDVTAPDKANNPELSLQIDKQEDQIAKRDLNSDDYKLYEDFERASNFTKSGKGSVYADFMPTTEGTIAKIIDSFIDGIGGFNFFVTDWLLSDAYDPALPLPTREVFEFCVRTGLGFLEKLDTCHDEQSRILLRELMISYHLDTILRRWSDINVSKLPGYVQELQEEFRENMEKLSRNL